MNRIGIVIAMDEERENIKQGIIAELYYKEGFKDGIDFIIKHMKKL